MAGRLPGAVYNRWGRTRSAAGGTLRKPAGPASRLGRAGRRRAADRAGAREARGVLEAGREVGEEGGAEAGDVGREVGALVADEGGEGVGPGRVEEALAHAEGGTITLGGGVA